MTPFGDEDVGWLNVAMHNAGCVGRVERVGNSIASVNRISVSRGRDTAKARAEYRDFLALWKDADPEISILKQAKAEYAKPQ